MKTATWVAKEFLWFFAALLMVEVVIVLFRSQPLQISSSALTKAAFASALIVLGRLLFHGKNR